MILEDDANAQRRDAILGAIRQSLGRGPLSGTAARELDERLARHPASLLPERAKGSRQEVLQRFVAMAEKAACSLIRLADERAVPKAAADYLRANNLPLALTLAPERALHDLPWQDEPLLQRRTGAAGEQDLAALTPALCAVAETGTLVLTSGPGHPSTLNFLPDHHLVVLKASDVVGGYEHAWTRLRAQYGAGQMPRTVNLVTGPSRTGDIELTIQLGAHGPRRLHILLVDDEAPSGD
ncbi:MAG: lactate utilization protein C [Alphaproteobacteria bacterium]|nr:lactate utilization protein C [Alphaproteobacteria bacterium]